MQQTVPDIYIVDDDDAVRKALSRLVATTGMRARTFASPADFLDADHSAPICCLLLDVDLPGMDGFELHERLVAKGATAPVIFVSARSSEGYRARARQAGAVAYLEKPFEDQALLDAIRVALDRHSSPSS